MDERAAREVLLVRALDRADPPLTGWSAAERAWATRVAAEQVGPAGTPDAFIAARAHAGLQRFLPPDAAASRAAREWLQRPLRFRGVVLALLAAGLVAGALLDAVASGRYINLLSLTVFGVLGWNAVAYVVLAARALWRLAGPTGTPGVFARGLARLGAARSPPPRPRLLAGTGLEALWPAFAAAWAAASTRITRPALAAALHAGAAGVAAGGLASLYLRGLVWDFRVGWESTFLTPESVQAILAFALGPAAALTGLPLPDADGVAALRLGTAGGGAPAAPWIHRYAVTVGLAVVLPRALLAAGSAVLARRRAARFRLPLDEPYYQQLLRQHRAQPATVRVWPHAVAPAAAAGLVLRAASAAVWGERVSLDLRPPVAFGAEESAGIDVPAPTDVALVLADLAATPEAEQQGRLLAALGTALPAGVPLLLVLDEAAFRARFGGLPGRLDARRAAWTALAAAHGATPVFLDLGAPEATVAAALQAALDRPPGDSHG